MLKRFIPILIAGFIGFAFSGAANAAVVTTFSLTFETSPSTIVGTGTLAITGFVPGSTYGSGAAPVTEFDAVINNHSFNFIGHFSALVFSGSTLTAITANAGLNPNTVLFTGNGLEFQYFLNGDPQVLQTGNVVVTQVAAVPEPTTWAMMVVGFACVGFMAYRRRYHGTALHLA